MKIDDIKSASYNPRKISGEQKRALAKSINEFGDLSGIILNKRTNTLIGGHQRVSVIKAHPTKIVTTPHTDNYGTVAMGNIVVKTEKGSFNVPLRVVDWDKRKEKLANIAANNHGGEFDNQKLGKLLAELDKSKAFDVELSGFTDAEVKNLLKASMNQDEYQQKYTRKLTSPIYKMTGKKPSLSQVYDTTKADELKASVKKAGLPKDIEKFLLAAAERHVVFNFGNAAEYYAHASKKVQGLMEDCALVIVDHNKAIEHGYLKLTEEIRDLVGNGQE